MDKIPITFEFEGKQYSGILSRVSGAGTTSSYHLIVNNFYKGILHKVNDKWVFYSQKGNLGHLAEEFGKAVESLI